MIVHHQANWPAKRHELPRRDYVVGARTGVSRGVVVEEQHPAGVVCERSLDQIAIIDGDPVVIAGAYEIAYVSSVGVVERECEMFDPRARQLADGRCQDAAVARPNDPVDDPDCILARNRDR